MVIDPITLKKEIEKLKDAGHDLLAKQNLAIAKKAHLILPTHQLLDAASEPALVRALAKRVERVRPVDSRLVRVHDCLWLRMWLRSQTGPLPDPASIQDVICTIAGH